MRQQLSRSFYLDEFARSETAARMGRDIEIPNEVVSDLTILVATVLQPLRDDLKRAIFVLSGYRPGWLNRAVGGSPNSQHMVGQAADIVVAGYTPLQVCRRIVALELPFDQLILEFDRWTHVSISSSPRGSVLTARKVAGRTQYLPGIVENAP